MNGAVRKPASYQDVLDAPEHMIAEIIDGELHLMPRPGPHHATASSQVAMDLGPLSRRSGRDGGSGGWRIVFEPELHMQEHILVPDLAGWRLERMPRLPKEAYFSVSPDWVCEVLSPRTVRTDRILKTRIYARCGVEYLWMVDPMAQTLEAFRLVGEYWQQVAVHGGPEKVRVPPFEAVELDLDNWWEEEEPVEPG